MCTLEIIYRTHVELILCIKKKSGKITLQSDVVFMMLLLCFDSAAGLELIKLNLPKMYE